MQAISPLVFQSMKKTLLIFILTASIMLVGCSSSSKKAEESTTQAKSDSTKKTCDEPSLDESKTYNVVFKTSKGSFSVELDVKNAPIGSAHLAALVKEGFYDGLTFHRVVPDFVIQGGDPLGNGTGGYKCSVISEEPPRPYKQGDFAWAKGGADLAGSASSQFFIVTGSDDSPSVQFLGSKQLGSDGTSKIQYGYAGKVISGLDVALAIEALAPGGDGEPTEKVTITSVKLNS